MFISDVHTCGKNLPCVSALHRGHLVAISAAQSRQKTCSHAAETFSLGVPLQTPHSPLVALGALSATLPASRVCTYMQLSPYPQYPVSMNGLHIILSASTVLCVLLIHVRCDGRGEVGKNTLFQRGDTQDLREVHKIRLLL